MRYKICLLLSILMGSMMSTGFAVNEVSNNDAAAIYSRLEVTAIAEPEIKAGFSCFDVNDRGDFVLGFNGEGADWILAYDHNGEYLFGYSIVDNGDFGIEWDHENIIYYSARSDFAVLIGPSGNCLDVKEIQNTAENNTYWVNEIKANKRIVDDTAYIARHWLINYDGLHWGAYPRLVKVAANGEETILFDASASLQAQYLSAALILGVIILFALILLVKRKLGVRKIGGKEN